MHIADNLDGTFSNPVMPSGHWSDPCVLRVEDDFYCVTSSIETCPLIQVLHSRDLVNWRVIGSAFRFWPDHRPPVMNWSPRISLVKGRFRIMFHNTVGGFSVAESDRPEGPYALVEHRFDNMHCNWAPNIFIDRDGSHYMIAGAWIQKADDVDVLGFIGPRYHLATDSCIPENPSLIIREGVYYLFESENGTSTWGLGRNRGKISVWRARVVTGPYEKCPHDMIRASLRFQSPNTGTAILGPDNEWYYIYNCYDALRPALCRQMHVDKLSWDNTGWPVVNGSRGPALTYPKPSVDPVSQPWIPDVNDEFDEPELEGVTGGALGSKWLFKEENLGSWSLSEHPGWLRMHTLYPSIETFSPANCLVQRPVSSYFEITTLLAFSANNERQEAGLLIREFQQEMGVAIGLFCDNVMQVGLWHGKGGGPMKRVAQAGWYDQDWKARGPIELKLLMEGWVIRAYYREAGASEWVHLGPDYTFGWTECWFTAFHPGLFSGATARSPSPGYADFDYFRHVDHEPTGT